MRPCLLFVAFFALTVPRALAADLLDPGRPMPEAIDHYVDAGLVAAAVRPAAAADDATIIRRLTLDLVGRIPTLAETRAYVSSTAGDKRFKLVDRLMASPGFVRHLTNEFDVMLAAPERPGGLRDYLSRAFTEKRSWDRVFRELMLADESKPATKGASEFLLGRVKDLDKLTAEVSSLFFGVN